MGIQKGDKVKVICQDLAQIQDPDVKKVFIGSIKDAFNALKKTDDGWEDDWVYKIVNEKGEWFLYKSSYDGGKITLIKKAFDNSKISPGEQ